MIHAIAILFLCQLAGETIARGLALPMPGPVIGLVLLLGGLAIATVRGTVTPGAIAETGLGQTTGGLLQNLSILFIPAGVGVIDRLDLLGRYGWALATALIVSAALSLAVTALVFVGVKRIFAGQKDT